MRPGTKAHPDISWGHGVVTVYWGGGYRTLNSCKTRGIPKSRNFSGLRASGLLWSRSTEIQRDSLRFYDVAGHHMGKNAALTDPKGSRYLNSRLQ